jgi:hypothetical protein
MTRVQVRFDTDLIFVDIGIDLSGFVVSKVYDDEVFGQYGFQNIFIKKDSLPKDFLGE